MLRADVGVRVSIPVRIIRIKGRKLLVEIDGKQAEVHEGDILNVQANFELETEKHSEARWH